MANCSVVDPKVEGLDEISAAPMPKTHTARGERGEASNAAREGPEEETEPPGVSRKIIWHHEVSQSSNGHLLKMDMEI